MKEALLGLVLGLTAGGLSVWSLWLVTGFTARASLGLSVPEEVERPSGWDAEAQDPDVVTAGQWIRARRETSEMVPLGGLPTGGMVVEEVQTDPTIPPPPSALPATLRIFFAFLLKAPILILIALLARSLGTDSLHWCVGGVVLVYSFAVLWAAGRTHRP